jgi:hypothetical protein
MEHIEMSILQLYIEDHSEPWQDQGLNCQYTPGSGFSGQTRATGACLPQLQLMLGHLLYTEWLKSSLTLKG